MRHLIFAGLMWLAVVSTAGAQPQLSVSATEVPGEGSVTVTVHATPGLYLAIVGSTRDGGLAYGGVNLQIGSDVRILFHSFVPATGIVAFPFTPPLANGVDVYYLLAVTSTSPDMVPPTPSATIALRPRGFYSFAPTFPQGLLAGGARIGGVGLPGAPDDAASKAYVDASQFRLGPPSTQAASTSTPLIDTEQTGAGDLMALRTNSTAFAGANGVNPNRVQFRVLPDGGFFARGQINIGTLPVGGAGERMMWAPYRAAFRVGGVTGAQWDDTALGLYSWASGYDSSAGAPLALAHGLRAVASGNNAVSIGRETKAAGVSAVALGHRVGACGTSSTALGSYVATATAPTAADPCGGTYRDGSLVLGDGSTVAYMAPNANHQFASRFAGGYRLYTNAAATVGTSLNAGGVAWNTISDRNVKYGIAPVDEADILRRLMSVPVSTFYYKDGDGQRYIGPMAQDFHAAFGFGDSDRMIRTIDVDGVTMASIQALGRQLQQLTLDNERLTQDNEALRRMVEAILARLDRLP